MVSYGNSFGNKLNFIWHANNQIIHTNNSTSTVNVLKHKVSDKTIYANSAYPDQTAPDQGLHCLPFY